MTHEGKAVQKNTSISADDMCCHSFRLCGTGTRQTAFHTADRIRVVSRRQLCTDFLLFFQRCSSDEGLCDTAGTEIKNCIAGGVRGYIGCKRKNAGGLYSTKGELTLYSDRASITARAFGVGGDFFTFHPLKLLSGSYFDGEDLNKDGVVIDENVAWQLFGSNNVAGMYVEINGVQYPVRGVVKSDKGYFSDAADEEAATVYVSYEILEGGSGSSTGGMDSAAASTPAAGTTDSKGGSYGQAAGTTLDSYELLIKNPVQKCGFNALKEALGLDESSYEIVENSSRFGLMNRFTVLRNFGIRSMNTKNIVFPYWENRARAYEDLAALLLILELLCLVYPVIFAAGKIHWLWKHKTEIRQKLVQWIKVFVKELRIWMKHVKAQERPVKKQ